MRRILDTLEAPPSPASSHGNGSGDANFDTNMVVILAALLCALICALGLNSIVRCVLRCGRRVALETPEEAAARRAATGLKKKALRQIPVAVYGAAEGASAIPVAATECPICLAEFADGEKVRVLPRCNHGFHVGCIDTWLVSHSSCPTCRDSLLEKPAAVSEPEQQRAAVIVVVEQIFFSKEALRSVYEPHLEPIPVPYNIQSTLVIGDIGVPDARRKAGRPKKNRIVSKDQPSRDLRCSNCNELGHNRRRCPNQPRE